MFRRRRPYGSPNGEDTMTYNSLRAAHVWLDNYIVRKYFLSLFIKIYTCSFLLHDRNTSIKLVPMPNTFLLEMSPRAFAYVD